LYRIYLSWWRRQQQDEQGDKEHFYRRLPSHCRGVSDTVIHTQRRRRRRRRIRSLSVSLPSADTPSLDWGQIINWEEEEEETTLSGVFRSHGRFVWQVEKQFPAKLRKSDEVIEMLIRKCQIYARINLFVLN
jgi:hypothetical protein